MPATCCVLRFLAVTIDVLAELLLNSCSYWLEVQTPLSMELLAPMVNKFGELVFFATVGFCHKFSFLLFPLCLTITPSKLYKLGLAAKAQCPDLFNPGAEIRPAAQSCRPVK
jgi:hypothetical protein